ncbi:MAG: glycosyltransferase family 4 protein [Actinomycetes bacterium]
MSVRLLVVTDAGARGGAESTLGTFLRGFRSDIDVTVLGGTPEVVEWLAACRPGSATIVLPEVRNRTDVLGMLRHRRAIRAARPDVVLFNLSTMSSCQWVLAAALTIRGLPIVAMENSPVGTWSSLSARLKRWTSARLAGHVTVGRRAAQLIEQLGDLPEGSLSVIYTGVERYELQPLERTSTDFTIGMLSRHDPVKGIDLAIHVVAQLGPGFRLIVVGDGAERSNLEALVDELDVADRVELRPWDDHARDVLGICDVYLLPSRLEAFPITIMEAMQAGVPVVATDVGSVREAAEDGVTGYVVPVGDVEAMAGAVRSLAADDAQRTRMAEAARSVALERFDSGQAVAAWEDLFDQILDGTVPSRPLAFSNRLSAR